MYEITKLLNQEHERLVVLFRQYQALRLEVPDDAALRLAEFAAGLERHMAIEEEILFPRFEKVTRLGNSGPTLIMRQEHLAIRHALTRLRAAPKSAGEQAEIESALVDAMRAHESMEELVFSPWLDETLLETERMGIFEQIKHFPAEVRGAAHG